MTRIVTGILLIAAVVAVVLWGSLPLVVAAAAILCLLGLWEFWRLAEAVGFRLVREPGYAFTLFLSAVALAASRNDLDESFREMAALWPALTILLLAAVMVKAMRGNRNLPEYFGTVAVSGFGPLYVALPLMMLVAVWMQPEGPFHVLFALAVIWTSDTAAYFIGKNFGRHRSSPRISPNKTWEGTIASFVSALLVGYVAAKYLWQGDETPVQMVFLAGVLNVAGQFGDLAESALKRSAGVKDSSSLIPGHGGVLDRLDALLFAAPLLWYYWLWRML